jgi:hypothetical protein
LTEALRVLSLFCDAFGMRVNVGKCEVLVFHCDPAVARSHMRGPQFHCFRLGDGTSWHVHKPPLHHCVKMKFVERARYLGLYYGPGAPFVSCCKELAEAGRRALYALLARLDACRIWAPATRIRCFETQVRAVVSYGAEIWGPDKLLGLLNASESAPAGARSQESVFERAFKDPAVQLQWVFLKRCVGAKAPARHVVFKELGQWPLHHYWLQLACGFWNRLVAAKDKPAGAMYHDVLVADWALADTGATRTLSRSPLGRAWAVDSWACKMRCLLLALGHEWAPDVHPTQQLLKVPAVLQLLENRLSTVWEPFVDPPDPRSYEGGDFKACVYAAWMLKAVVPSAEEGNPTRYLSMALPLGHVHALATLRACAWPLEIYRACVNGRRSARASRVCRCCSMQVVEDERHVLLECPAYGAVRTGSGLCFGTSDVRVFLATRPPGRLAAFVHSVKRVRGSLLSLP